jgi:hypothetical protein
VPHKIITSDDSSLVVNVVEDADLGTVRQDTICVCSRSCWHAKDAELIARLLEYAGKLARKQPPTNSGG